MMASSESVLIAAPEGSKEKDGSFSTPEVGMRASAGEKSACWGKRMADDPASGACDSPAKIARHGIHPSVVLGDVQRSTLLQFLKCIDVGKESLVITNPLVKDNPLR